MCNTKNKLSKMHFSEQRDCLFQYGSLNLKWEFFKFLLLLCEEVYFLLLFVVSSNTQSQDAAKEPLQTAGALMRRKASECLSICLCAQVWFGWGLCSGLQPLPSCQSLRVSDGAGKDREQQAGRWELRVRSFACISSSRFEPGDLWL